MHVNGEAGRVTDTQSLSPIEECSGVGGTRIFFQNY